MDKNPLQQLADYQQSAWLDYIKKDLMQSGELKALIANDNLRGITSNPSLFEKAISSHLYDSDIQQLGHNTPLEIYEALALKDVANAADEFLTVYNATNGADGYVSIEVNPHLAHDTEGSIVEARRLWTALNRPNICIKVPATKAGLPVITALISEGINVNVTLLFSLERYREVALAYIAGLEARLTLGKSISNIHSVASFFLSRIDGIIDPLLEKTNKPQIQGEIAIASAKLAYQIYKEIFTSERFINLKKLGAHAQRLLWASTSTKNPNYSDVKYVEALIGPNTVNTLPLETLKAYRDHGQPQLTLTENIDAARSTLVALQTLGIDLAVITEELEKDGLIKFKEAFDNLLATIEAKATDNVKV